MGLHVLMNIGSKFLSPEVVSVLKHITAVSIELRTIGTLIIGSPKPNKFYDPLQTD